MKPQRNALLSATFALALAAIAGHSCAIGFPLTDADLRVNIKDQFDSGEGAGGTTCLTTNPDGLPALAR